jgi:predicted MFS family arabinose efflux permease
MVYPFLPFFAEGLGVSLEQITRAITFRQTFGALGPFLAILADRRGRKFGMLLGVGFFMLAMGLVTVWPTFLAFTAAMTLALIGNFVFNPSLQAYIGDRVPYERRGRALAVTELGWSISIIVGVPLMGLLIARAGWQAPFIALLGLGLLCLVALLLLVPADGVQQLNGSGFWRSLVQVLSCSACVAGLLMGLFTTTANEVVNILYGTWLRDIFNLQIAALGVAALFIGLSELAGEVLVGGFTDRLGKQRSIAWGLALNSAMALLLPLLGKTVPGAVVGLFLFYLTFEFTIVASIPLMTEVLPQARVATMALMVVGHSLGRALGALGAPTLYTWGIWGPVLAAAVFNLFAWLALRKVQVGA